MNKSKPPIGICPEYIYELTRVQDICRALYEYSRYEDSIENYNRMLEWTNELRNRLEILKDNPKLKKEELIKSICKY